MSETYIKNKELSLCPLCGGKLEVCFEPKTRWEANAKYYVACVNEDFFTGQYTSEDKAIAIANTRYKITGVHYE